MSAEHSAKAEHATGRVRSTTQRRSTLERRSTQQRRCDVKGSDGKVQPELDGFIRELRKKLSHSEVAEDAELLLKYVEDEFFGSELVGRVE